MSFQPFGNFKSEEEQRRDINCMFFRLLNIKNPQNLQSEENLAEFWYYFYMNFKTIIDLSNSPNVSIIDANTVEYEMVIYKLVSISTQYQVSREACLRSNINHPNIMPSKYRIAVLGINYMLTPNHLSMRDFRTQKVGNWVNMLMQIADGLIFLCSKGIYLSHLNPDNIFVDDQRILISELAQVTERQAKYTSPEVLYGCGFTEKSYCWTFACLIVFLLTGNDPFQDLPEQEEEFRCAILDENVLKALLSNKKLEIAKKILKKVFKYNCRKRPTLLDMFNHLKKYN